jgi:hypothetical protein
MVKNKMVKVGKATVLVESMHYPYICPQELRELHRGRVSESEKAWKK